MRFFPSLTTKFSPGLRPGLRRTLGIALLALALLLLPWVLTLAGTAWVRITNLALLFAMLALGLNIVVGYAGLLDLGYIAFFAVGAYAYALLASPHFGMHWSFLTLLPLGALLAAVFGVILGAPTLKLKGDYLAIVTLGFGEIIRIFMNNLNRPINITNGPQGITLIDPIQVGGLSLNKTYEFMGLTFAPVHSYYFVFLLCALATILISLRLQNSRIGRAWVAIREDELAASAMGINTRNVKLLAFAMGASFGGASGAVYDYDGDGFDDIFVTDSDAGKPNHLFHNNGNGTFTDVTRAAHLSGYSSLSTSVPCTWFTYTQASGSPGVPGKAAASRSCAR